MLKIEGLDEGATPDGLAVGDELIDETDSAEEDDAWLVALDQLTAPQTEHVITQLTAGVRNPNRVNVFLDGRFAFSLDVTQVVDFGLKSGQKISPDRYDELENASEFGKLYQRTLEWVLVRPRSLYEVQSYLKQRQARRRILNKQREHQELKPLPEFPDSMLDVVVARIKEKDYVDDCRFAEYYIENRYVRRGISHKRLRLELSQKGVAADIIETALRKIGRPEDEEILKIIAKKYKKYDETKLTEYLVRQGFSYQQAKTAVAKWYEEHN